MKLNKAIAVAKNLPLESPVPLEFKLRSAADVVTLDRLRVVDRLQEIAADLVNSGQPAFVLGVAELLEKEIREAQR